LICYSQIKSAILAKAIEVDYGEISVQNTRFTSTFKVLEPLRVSSASQNGDISPSRLNPMSTT